VDALLNQGDQYLVLADYAAYVACQDEVDRVYRDPDEWARRAIHNSAGMGKFSSDRTIAEYARDIWKTSTVAVSADRERCLHEGVCVAE
jgi:starch phosphorylase